jgi:hypothetical protein
MAELLAVETQIGAEDFERGHHPARLGLTWPPSPPSADVAGRSYEFVPDGVYFDLPERLYFAQDALGSSDLIRLWKHKHGWWWSVALEPGPGRARTGRERIYGHGAHALVLEGPDAYARKFAVQPSTRPANALVTAKDCKRALERGRLLAARDERLGGRGLVRRRRLNLPTMPCWPNMLAEFAEGGRRAAGPDRRRRPHAADHARGGDGRPDIAYLLGAARASRRWPRCRCCGPMRAALAPALAVRPAVPGLHAGPEDARQLGGRPLSSRWATTSGAAATTSSGPTMTSAAASSTTSSATASRSTAARSNSANSSSSWSRPAASWDWVWLFYQKPEPTGRAPVLFPVYDDNELGPAEVRPAKAAKALAFYREAVAEFGLLKPWTSVETLHYTGGGSPNLRRSRSNLAAALDRRRRAAGRRSRLRTPALRGRRLIAPQGGGPNHDRNHHLRVVEGPDGTSPICPTRTWSTPSTNAPATWAAARRVLDALRAELARRPPPDPNGRNPPPAPTPCRARRRRGDNNPPTDVNPLEERLNEAHAPCSTRRPSWRSPPPACPGRSPATRTWRWSTPGS